MGKNVESFYEESKLVNTYDVDINNRLKLNSLFNYLQDVASTHAEHLKLGFNDLIVNDLGWVLSWARVEIVTFPHFGETIKLRTWPKCKYKLFSMRDFYVYNEKGDIIFRVSTAWLLINVKTKKISDTQNLPQQIYYQPGNSAVGEFPEKIISGTDKETLFTKIIRYTDLDINQHVNNTKYIELALDCFSPEYHKNNNLKSLTVSFASECFFGDEIEVRLSPQKNLLKKNIIEEVNIKSGKTVFLAAAEWND